MDVERIMMVLGEISAERFRQDQKWGADRNQSVYRWLSILGEEVGEAHEAALEAHPEQGHLFDPRDREFQTAAHLSDMRVELVQVAAVAVAIIEWIDRGAAAD